MAALEVAALADIFPLVLAGMLEGTAGDVLRGRPMPTVWSPLEYATHVGAAVTWYVERIRRVLTEDEPQLHAFDWDEACDRDAYRDRSVERILMDVRSSCSELAKCARSVGGADLARRGLGSDGGPRTVRELLGRAGHELVHHEWDLRRGLSLVTQRADAEPQ